MTANRILAALLIAAALMTGAIAMRAQSQVEEKDPLVFDVASVKPSAGCPPACGLIRPTLGSGGYHVEGAPLRLLMTVAYTVTDRQIAGGPSWLGTDRFDIEAKAGKQRTTDELHLMLQHLLEERFQLKIRHEERQQNVWNMVQAKEGAKLTAHDPDDKNYPPIGQQMNKAADGSLCPGFSGQNIRMDYLAFFLSRGLDRTVLDKTGLSGRFDLKVQFLPDGMRLNGDSPNGPNISPDCADLYSALPKQLGLKLEAGKGPVNFLVVEKAEKPTEN